MPKLYFRHGSVSSSKTMNLLAVAHTYKQQGKKVLLIKPSVDIRFGAEAIKSRSGLSCDADILIGNDTNIFDYNRKNVKIHCVLVDEVQFLEPRHIDQLRMITLLWDVPVICYGLRTDFRTELFPAVKRLMEVADNIEEIKTTCYYCNKKAVFNLKHTDGVADCSGKLHGTIEKLIFTSICD